MSFSSDIKKFSEKTEKAYNAVFRGTALDLARRIIKRTPVDTGRARANWKVQINIAPSIVSDSSDKTGARTMKEASNVISRYKFGDSIFIVNNLPYIEALEDGHSDQRPNGMVKVTVQEFKHIVAMRARKE